MYKKIGDTTTQAPEVLELERVEEDAEELAPYEENKRTLLTDKLRRWVREVPRIKDPKQKKAGGNVLRFLALMLLLTLVARGTAGATLATVTVGTLTNGEVVQAVRGNGVVSALGSVDIEVPEGLTVHEALVSAGQKVKEGDALVRFKLDELNERIAREENTLQEKQLELRILQQAPATEGDRLSSAQTTADRARQDYDAAKAHWEQQLAAAQSAVDAANAALQNAQNALGALPPDATPEEIAAAQEAVNAAQEALEVAQQTLQSTQNEAGSAVQNAQRALEDANADLEAARQTHAQNQQSAANTSQQNAIKADGLQLDIQKQEELLEALHSLEEAEGFLLATCAGTVTQVPQEGVQTTSAPVVRLADGNSGYEAVVQLDKNDAKDLVAGGTAEVTLPGGSMYYTPTAQATITAVGAADDNGQVPVTLKLPQGDWAQGQSVQVRVVQSKQNYSSCVPVGALRANQDGYYVLVVRTVSTVLGTQNQLAEVPVVLLAKDDTLAAIEAPQITPGEQIVVSGSRPLQAGDRVRVAE